ncbi:MAG: type II secretion system protein [Acidobacteria bacterium]|nr:type II secretion system protein [Acidobacteriota bacterium]
MTRARDRRSAAGEAAAGARPRRGERGFTLIEMVVSMMVLAVAMTIAAELLGESQQMLVDAGRQALDPAAALVATRLRSDVQGAVTAVAVQAPDLSCVFLELFGHPAGPIVYRLDGGDLVRSVLAPTGAPLASGALLRGATSLRCATSSLGGGPTVVLLTYSYRRSRARRSPLMLVPSLWAPAKETVTESLILTPRGAGLGSSW